MQQRIPQHRGLIAQLQFLRGTLLMERCGFFGFREQPVYLSPALTGEKAKEDQQDQP